MPDEPEQVRPDDGSGEGTAAPVGDRSDERPDGEEPPPDADTSVDEAQRGSPADEPSAEQAVAGEDEPARSSTEPTAERTETMAVASDLEEAEETRHGVRFDELSSASGPERNTANETNAAIVGELHVWYSQESRSIALPMDADAALRCIATWRFNRPTAWWEDRIDPATSSGHVSWAAISLDEVRAMMWLPALGSGQRPQRMAVDPDVA